MKLKSVAGRSLLFVMAVEAEYGDQLRKRIEPLITGVGPVEAAISVASCLAVLSIEEKLPDLLVCLGSAGSRTLAQAEIYQASSVSYRDMDASPLGFAKGKTPFLDIPAEILLPLTIPGIPSVRLSTGGNIVSGAAYDFIDADMVDMETYSVLRAGMRFGIPMIGLRGISDGAAELHHIDNWTQYLHIIDEKLALAVDSLEAGIADGSIPL